MKKVIFGLYALLVGFLSLRQAEGPGIEHVDKVMHFGAYGIFAVFGFMAAKHTRTFYWMCVAIIVYGGLLEIAQFYVADRTMEFFDFVANTLGVLAGVVVISLVKNLSQKQVSVPGE